MKKILKNIGMRIKLARLSADLKQEELAKLVGVYPTYISQLEHGKKEPSISLLFKISQVTNFHFSIDL